MNYHLILVRHAKSSWQIPGAQDFERPLNDRGLSDAPAMGKILQQKKVNCKQILCSPAARTQKTLELLSQEWKHNAPVEYPEDLYHASAKTLLAYCNSNITSLPLMIVTHNPGITEFVSKLCNVSIDNIPTMGVSLIKINNLSKIEMGDGELVEFLRPKSLFRSGT